MLVAVIFGLALMLGIVNSGACSEPIEPVPGPEPIARPEIKHVANADIISLPTLPIPRLILAGRYVIKKGEFLTTEFGPNAPEGFLLKAVSRSVITVGPGQPVETTVRTTPASIFEAEPGGEIVASPADFEKPGANQIPLAPAPEPTKEDVFAALVDKDSEPGLFWQAVQAHVSVKCTGQTAMPDLTPTVTPHFDPTFALHWTDGKFWKRRIREAEAKVKATLALEVSGVMSAGFDCALKPDRGVPIFLIPVPTPLGVPVPVRVEVIGELTAHGNIASDEKGALKVDLEGSAGVQYRDRRVKVERRVEGVKGTLHLPELNAQAEVGFRAKPGLSFEAGWRAASLGKLAAVAEVKIGTGVDLKYNQKKKTKEACIPLEVQGGFYFYVPKGFGRETKPKNAVKPLCEPLGDAPKEGAAN